RGDLAPRIGDLGDLLARVVIVARHMAQGIGFRLQVGLIVIVECGDQLFAVVVRLGLRPLVARRVVRVAGSWVMNDPVSRPTPRLISSHGVPRRTVLPRHPSRIPKDLATPIQYLGTVY